ncbi:MAG: PEP-CTERM sorting domain-containing protein [Opitutaceae bacterium]
MISLAQAATWDFGGTPDKNWSTFLNWGDDASQANKAVIFDDTAGKGTVGTVGNIVDANVTIDSLTYANIGATVNDFQVTQISSGVTLTLDAAVAPTDILRVGSASLLTTNAVITGLGTLTINESASNVNVANGSSTNARASLDMSGLSTFNATVNSFNLGVGSRGPGDITLAATNTITAISLKAGDSGGSSTTSGQVSDLLLGRSNTLNIDTITIGANLASGSMKFQTLAGLPVPSVIIRAQNGTGRAAMNIANVGTIAVTNGQTSTVDFSGSGGSVDALVSTLLIAKRADSGTGALVGTLTMANGTFDATSAIVGQTMTATGGTGATTGNINVSGGTFTAGSVTLAQKVSGTRTGLVGNLNVSGTGAVVVTGNLTVGDVVAGTGIVTANVAVSGGNLTVGGNLVEGANGASVTSTVTLSGTGIIDMTAGTLAVDTLNLTGGTLKNTAALTVGTLAFTSGTFDTVTATAVNTALTFSTSLSGSFTSLGLIGTLTLGGSANLNLALANDYTPTTGFLLVDNDTTLDSITGTFATVNGGAFGSGNTFTLTNNMGTYNFALSYTGGDGNDLSLQLVSIPEPSAYAMLAGAAVMLTVAVVRRRRRQAA